MRFGDEDELFFFHFYLKKEIIIEIALEVVMS